MKLSRRQKLNRKQQRKSKPGKFQNLSKKLSRQGSRLNKKLRPPQLKPKKTKRLLRKSRESCRSR